MFRGFWGLAARVFWFNRNVGPNATSAPVPGGLWGVSGRYFCKIKSPEALTLMAFTGTSAQTLPVRLFRAVSGAFRVGISETLNPLSQQKNYKPNIFDKIEV